MFIASVFTEEGGNKHKSNAHADGHEQKKSLRNPGVHLEASRCSQYENNYY